MHFQVKWTVRLDYVICLFYIVYWLVFCGGGGGGVKFNWYDSDSISLHVKIVLLGFFKISDKLRRGSYYMH